LAADFCGESTRFDRLPSVPGFFAFCGLFHAGILARIHLVKRQTGLPVPATAMKATGLPL
jgi:hypothetical protein